MYVIGSRAAAAICSTVCVDRPSDVPLNRGELTIAWLHAASGPDEHVARVLEWARSTWIAWNAFHELARQWIAEAGGRAG